MKGKQRISLQNIMQQVLHVIFQGGFDQGIPRFVGISLFNHSRQIAAINKENVLKLAYYANLNFRSHVFDSVMAVERIPRSVGTTQMVYLQQGFRFELPPAAWANGTPLQADDEVLIAFKEGAHRMTIWRQNHVIASLYIGEEFIPFVSED